MEKTWRWFGKKDKITLSMLRQIGVEGIVTALHDVPNGEVWTREKIRDLREYIESYGMRWSVVESLPVCESIKYAGPDRDLLIENYKQCIRNLSKFGVKVICYNFMPVFDWTRTQLDKVAPDGSTSLVMYWEQMKGLDPLKDDIHLPGLCSCRIFGRIIAQKQKECNPNEIHSPCPRRKISHDGANRCCQAPLPE